MKLLALKFHSQELRPGASKLSGVFNQDREDWNALERFEREQGISARPEPPADDVANFRWLRHALRELGKHYGRDPAFLVEYFDHEKETADSRRFLASHPNVTFRTVHAIDVWGRVTVGEVGSAEVVRPPFREADLLVAAMVSPFHYPFFPLALLGGTRLLTKDVAASLEAAASPIEFERRLFAFFPSILIFDAQEDGMTLVTEDRDLVLELKGVMA